MCNICQQLGHTSSDCRKFNGLISDDPPTTEKQPQEDNGDNDESDDIYEAYGEHFLRMIHPLMLTQPCFSQWHNIFRSKCLTGGKVCDIITDKSSVDNYISSNVVKKLEMLVTPHPTPYKVRWINSSSSQHITHQCHGLSLFQTLKIQSFVM